MKIMSVWKKLFLVLFFINAMYFGGLGIQSESALAQGFGFLTVIVAFVLLYIISQAMWHEMGFISSFLIIGSIVIFILYSLGLLGQEKTRGRFIGDSAPPQNYSGTNYNDENTGSAEIDTHINQDLDAEQSSDSQTVLTQTDNSGGWMDKIKNYFSDTDSATPLKSDFNPTEYPYLEGKATVVTASVLRMEGLFIKLLGIDAPDPEQTCADRHGAPYRCGKRALTWLQNWLQDKSLKCYIVGKIENNRTTGVCMTSDGQYDVAAVVVNAGWALAYTVHTAIYEPYEAQAADNRRGLWRGHFYKPWDWRRIQNRKVKIKIEGDDSGFMGWLKGLF